MNEMLSRIAVDPQVCFGKPCVRGTRIWVSLLLDFLASGATIEEILENYPQLKREDVLAGAGRRADHRAALDRRGRPHSHTGRRPSIR
jgi:uncharacterized protein (DUF433 family)